MNIAPLIDTVSSIVGKINGLDTVTRGLITTTGRRICEGIVEEINNDGGDAVLTKGYDADQRLAFAINDRPEIHYHNTFNFYVAVGDPATADNVESAIKRIVESIPSK